MKKRTFIKVTAITAAGSVLLPITSCSPGDKSGTDKKSTMESGSVPVFELPALAYGFDALEPSIDARTMKIHHDKHHAGYVRKLNAAIEGKEKYAGKTLEDIVKNVKDDETAVRNNGGGHYNHTLFWETMSPKQTEPKGDMLDKINGTFGDMESFKSQFKKAALGQFGSGWAWLCIDGKDLIITSTPNQDNPLMTDVVEGKPAYPILGLDVWEHAYYLKYQNMRGNYINNFFDVINWDAVTERFMAHMKG